MENQAVIQSFDQPSLQSRWGHHPCNRDTFLKLKRLHKAFWEHVRKFAAYERWEAKDEPNRRGKAPLYCPLFAVSRSWGKCGDSYGMARHTELHFVRQTFQEARVPSPVPVKAFDADTLRKIDDLLAGLAAWNADNGILS